MIPAPESPKREPKIPVEWVKEYDKKQKQKRKQMIRKRMEEKKKEVLKKY